MCIRDRHGIEEVLMDCDKDNLASAKTMKALGGKKLREYYDDVHVHCICLLYTSNLVKKLLL